MEIETIFLLLMKVDTSLTFSNKLEGSWYKVPCYTKKVILPSIVFTFFISWEALFIIVSANRK